MNKKSAFITQSAMIAAMYAALTVCTWQFSSLAIQFRLAEAMCVLPALTPAAIPGLTVGCALANLFAGNIPDAIFGTLATMLAAIATKLLADLCKGKLLGLYPLPAVLFNTVAVPFILYYGYGYTTFGNLDSAVTVILTYALSVFIGQTTVCYGVGIPLYLGLKKAGKSIFERKKF
jgi:uncharacterized membrane protein